MTKELIPTSEELTIYQIMATTATKSQMFSKIGGDAGLLSLMLMARELGLPPMQAIMGGLNIIQGKVEISPRMMNTMIRKAGHRLEIIESSDQICKIRGVRHDTKEEYVSVFSIDDARRACLVKSGGGWEKYASDMLFARCISRLARRLFADVISTAYVEGEIDRDDDTPSYSSNEKKEQSEITIAPAPPKEELITADEAVEIENLLVDEDKEYRDNLLRHFGHVNGTAPIQNFFFLPRKNLQACMKSIRRKRTDRLKQSEPKEDIAQLRQDVLNEEIPF